MPRTPLSSEKPRRLQCSTDQPDPGRKEQSRALGLKPVANRHQFARFLVRQSPCGVELFIRAVDQDLRP